MKLLVSKFRLSCPPAALALFTSQSHSYMKYKGNVFNLLGVFIVMEYHFKICMVRSDKEKILSISVYFFVMFYKVIKKKMAC